MCVCFFVSQNINRQVLWTHAFMYGIFIYTKMHSSIKLVRCTMYINVYIHSISFVNDKLSQLIFECTRDMKYSCNTWMQYKSECSINKIFFHFIKYGARQANSWLILWRFGNAQKEYSCSFERKSTFCNIIVTHSSQ